MSRPGPAEPAPGADPAPPPGASGPSPETLSTAGGGRPSGAGSPAEAPTGPDIAPFPGFAGPPPDRPPGALTRAVPLAALLLLTLGVALWAMTVGARPLPLSRVTAALLHGGAAREDLLVLTVRLPRVLAGLGIGAALAAAGAMLQTVTRNPLAEPGLLGINAGAALAAVAVLSLGAGSRGTLLGAAFLGAAAAAALVHLLASLGRGGATPLSFTLAGVVTGSFLAALTTALLIFDTATLDAVRVWTAGSLAGQRMEDLRLVLPLIALALAAAWATRGGVAVLGFGAEVARGLGLDPRIWWPLVTAMVAALAGASVALAGPVGFLGLIVPHALRPFAGADYRRLLPLAMVAGAGLAVLADALPRAIWGRDMPVGVTLAFLGGPVFLWLAARTAAGGRG